MPVSEFIIGTLRREVAQAGLAHIQKNTPKAFHDVPGSLSNSVGHIFKHNGKDIAAEYKPILGLEWDRIESFHSFYPASIAFQSFISIFGPYAAAKAQPQLFQPSPNSSSFQYLLTQGAARILISPAAAAKKDDVSAAWSTILETVGTDSLVGQWSGWGVEGDEGTWAGILSWKGVDKLEQASAEVNLTKAVQKLKALVDTDDYMVSFTSEAAPSS